ncbi:hypothetical protein DPMN_174106 [Dreissena polymorpha]|uniref:Uncharacterized protein n=1 Tax=Dreissena polymorpha TaxID=45954 RepID=A0A9D4IG50_DREPO|nr:hypothetical protein DPMN_174106 [Dreissena polymorpha]
MFRCKSMDMAKVDFEGRWLLYSGDPNHVFTLQGKSAYDVIIPSESRGGKGYDNNAICVFSNDQILVAIFYNKRVKLLNHQYQVVAHCDLTASPNDMCQVTPSEVAVSVYEYNTNEVQFVSVDFGQLTCISPLALHLTSFISGELLNKLYEDTAGHHTVFKCKVSPTGDQIFVTNHDLHKVLNLARDVMLLGTITYPDLRSPTCVRVTAQGQVLVCGYHILQLDCEGKKKMAIIANYLDSQSICFNRSTASIFVGKHNAILVFRVQ